MLKFFAYLAFRQTSWEELIDITCAGFLHLRKEKTMDTFILSAVLPVTRQSALLSYKVVYLL